MLYTKLVLASLVAVSASPGRRLSYSPIAGYNPGSLVTEHIVIDKDQKMMETILKTPPVEWTHALEVYDKGAHSKAYAEFTLSAAIGQDVDAKMIVVGQTSAGIGVEGYVKSSVSATSTTLQVVYSSAEDWNNVPSCASGALAVSTHVDHTPITTKCFQDAGTLTIKGKAGKKPLVDFTVTTVSQTATKAGRTLKGFSTGAKSKMYDGCPGCPYHDYLMYYNYYGDFNYADTWVRSALNGVAANFPNGAPAIKPNADFATVMDDATRIEAAKKGSAYMNTWMYVIREFEDAIDDCTANCIDCNDGPVHAVDEAVAFWTGSVEANNALVGDIKKGHQVYTLADKRCNNFKTCGVSGGSTSGKSHVNFELFKQVSLMQYQLLMGQCEAVRPILHKVTALMTIPLIQGTIKYAYPTQRAATKGRSEGATFAAAVLPKIHYCSAADAAVIYQNMKIGQTTTDFNAVKTAFENNYACLNITCAQVGGFVNSDGSLVAANTAACTDPIDPMAILNRLGLTDDQKTGVIVGSVVGGLAIVFLFLCVCCMFCKEKQGKPMFTNMQAKA